MDHLYFMGNRYACSNYFSKIGGIALDKKYEQMEFLPGRTIDEVVAGLLKCREEGKLAFAKFNGVNLYSDTVTLDSAYKEITGMTKSEFEELIK
jgi:hypothetical protein